MTHVVETAPVMVGAGTVLVAGLALALVADRRGWAPSLRVAIGTGLVLRLLLLALAAHDPWQPYDFDSDFSLTAQNVLTRHDLILNIREGGWHFLPLCGYIFAGFLRFGQLVGLPWRLIGRLAPMLADVVLIPLVGRLAPDRGPLRRFQYACVPVALGVSTLHAQIEPIALVFGVAAFIAARPSRAKMPSRAPKTGISNDSDSGNRWAERLPSARAISVRLRAAEAGPEIAEGAEGPATSDPAVTRSRGGLAGLLLGLAISAGSWPVLLVPGVLLTLRGAGARLVALGWMVAVPAAFLLTIPLVTGEEWRFLHDDAKELLSTRPVVGDWGWTSWFTNGESLSPGLAKVGTILLAVGLATTCYLWRRADPIDLTVVILITFVVVTARFGSQYLLWPIPFMIVRPVRFTWAAITAMSAWAAAGYVYLSHYFGRDWAHLQVRWALSSTVVIAIMVAAIPWARRRRSEQPRAVLRGRAGGALSKRRAGGALSKHRGTTV